MERNIFGPHTHTNIKGHITPVDISTGITSRGGMNGASGRPNVEKTLQKKGKKKGVVDGKGKP